MMVVDGLATSVVITLGIALYGAFLSTVVALRGILNERRRVRIFVKSVWWTVRRGHEDEIVTLPIVMVRVVNPGRRPVHVRQAHVRLESGTHFHPATVRLKEAGPAPPALLTDGEHVTILWNARSFEEDGYMPKRVFVRGDQEDEYERRLTRRERLGIRQMIALAVKNDAPHGDGRGKEDVT